jgi:uncharacterized protein
MKFSLFEFSLFIVLLGPLFLHQAFAEEVDYYPYPQPDAGYVTDHANLLTDDEELRLERWLLQTEENSGVEIIVVTIEAMSDYDGTNNYSIESFATSLFNTYGIGNMPKNDGVLLLVSRDDRKARIELGKHYGRYRDDNAMRIMQEVIIPEFKRNDYAAGITDGTEAVIEEFAGMRVTFPWDIVWVALAALSFLLIGISCIKNGKRGWGYVFVGLAVILILLALYLLRVSLEQSNTAGGSGGFGGGSSGGGGATGSW